ncbi:L-serine ammonia-lyase, iron-sulfur-dependent subunit beta [Clostridium grantii]|uniref:L-serine deaminase n=1 Tax=Clostridium grantii DSM 8605 TaxID=1121316 RepID=A0A1M5RSD6_9CLOT|nr:L-serine ammonia-lyase, iron-sulfur-dependent subunit beta [Clostridium grantii]SHH29194.1 L-serine dehydratase [Clostridium grantii DSM 8605]
MKSYSLFDIVGPIMIGPSSSHTAGAARLGKIASIIAGEGIEKVDFYLHGSFGKTYKGHGTDKALVAGILGMEPWDDDLKESFNLANKKGLIYNFIEEDLGDVHPNTVKFNILKKDGKIFEVIGSSVGGGNIKIISVDGLNVDITGDYPTIIINHIDNPGVISKVTALLYNDHINIAFLKVFRAGRGSKATMIIETDSNVSQQLIENIQNTKDILSVKYINPVGEGE